MTKMSSFLYPSLCDLEPLWQTEIQKEIIVNSIQFISFGEYSITLNSLYHLHKSFLVINKR